jgi:hypothetical protein
MDAAASIIARPPSDALRRGSCSTTDSKSEDELHFGRSRFVVNENTWLFVSRWLRPLREKVSFGI